MARHMKIMRKIRLLLLSAALQMNRNRNESRNGKRCRSRGAAGVQHKGVDDFTKIEKIKVQHYA